jgi:2,3-bisphosphoglycerate-independent phosphoglycerate mutase
MKYIILIGDGMADLPIEELKGKTPLEAAETPNMDLVARSGKLGLLRTVPRGYPPGSDVANLSILGYDPAKYYTGRAPLEAASMGIRLAPEDTAFRCNLVTLDQREGAPVMDDYSSGHISTEEARELVIALDKTLSGEGVKFHPGKSYRHLMVMSGAPRELYLTPPHDITDKEIEPYLPAGEGAERLKKLIERSQEVLRDHPVNRARRDSGKKTADSIWLWGEGTAPRMPTFRDRFDIEGAIISAVDLMNGIGVYAGFEVITVPGATGYLDTDYGAKAEYALKALKGKNLVCVHVEAPDEAGHQGSLEEKIKAIENFDSLVVGRVLEGVESFEDFRLMVVTDHFTPIVLKTHTPEPVPYAVLSGKGEAKKSEASGFNEKSALTAGLLHEDCEAFIVEFIGKPLPVS